MKLNSNLRRLSLAALLTFLTPFPAMAATSPVSLVKMDSSLIGVGYKVATFGSINVSPILVEARHKLAGGLLVSTPVVGSLDIGLGLTYNNGTKRLNKLSLAAAFRL